jgi:hypothetical protein
MFYVILTVALIYSVAAFVLRDAPPRVARIFWALVWAMVTAAAVLVVALIRNPALERTLFGPLGL